MENASSLGERRGKERREELKNGDKKREVQKLRELGVVIDRDKLIYQGKVVGKLIIPTTMKMKQIIQKSS